MFRGITILTEELVPASWIKTLLTVCPWTVNPRSWLVRNHTTIPRLFESLIWEKAFCNKFQGKVCLGKSSQWDGVGKGKSNQGDGVGKGRVVGKVVRCWEVCGWFDFHYCPNFGRVGGWQLCQKCLVVNIIPGAIFLPFIFSWYTLYFSFFSPGYTLTQLFILIFLFWYYVCWAAYLHCMSSAEG